MLGHTCRQSKAERHDQIRAETSRDDQHLEDLRPGKWKATGATDPPWHAWHVVCTGETPGGVVGLIAPPAQAERSIGPDHSACSIFNM